MTREEKIELLEKEKAYMLSHGGDRQAIALDSAIKALEQESQQEPKTGHWIFVDKANEHAHCSECDYGNVDLLDGRPHNYCPNCGAKMIEPQESEDK